MDTSSTLLGFTQHLKFDGEAGEIALAVIGVVVVLVAGSIWRSRRMRELDSHAAATV